MKLRNLVTLSIVAAALSGSTVYRSFAAAPEGEGPEGGGGPGGKPPRHEGRGFGGAGLSEEDRAKVKAVLDKVKDDPTVATAERERREANKEYREALAKKIPSLAGGPGGEHRQGPPGGGRGRPSKEEMEKRHAAMAEAEKDPAVKAAAEKRDAANKAFKEALKTAILKEDPSLSSIADKVVEQAARRGGREGGPRRGGVGKHRGPGGEAPPEGPGPGGPGGPGGEE